MALVSDAPAFFPDLREKAIIFQGDECSAKASELFETHGLPGGLLPLQDIIEGGWVEETGFVWMVTRRTQEHHFVKADRHCIYDELVCCTIQNKKMKDIRGVKAKDLLLWVPVNEIYIDEKDPAKIHFKSFMGLSRTFATDCFVTGA